MRDPRLKLYRGTWCVVWSEDGRTKRRSLSTDDEDEAKRRFEDSKRKPAGRTCADIFAAYLADRKQRIRHHARLEECWKNLKPECGHLHPEHIGRLWCRAYTEKRRALGRADGTIRKELSVLSAALHWGNKLTPAVIEMPPLPPPRDRHLTREECARLVEAAEGHIRLFIVLALTTAGRREAILQLTWERVDFERGLIALGDGRRRTKGRATVPIHPLALTPLQDARRAARTPFVIEWADRPVKSVRTAFDHACAVAGLEDVSPHVLRHTAAIQMAEGGTPMSEIAAYMGHSNSRITERHYAKYSPDYLRKAGAAIGWTVRGGSP